MRDWQNWDLQFDLLTLCPPPVVCVASLNSGISHKTQFDRPQYTVFSRSVFVGLKCYFEIHPSYPAQPSNGRMISRCKEFWLLTKNLRKSRGIVCYCCYPDDV